MTTDPKQANRKKHYTKRKNTSLTGLCGNSMTFSQFSVLTNTLQKTRWVERRVAINRSAHYGTSGWGVGYFVKGDWTPDPRQIQPCHAMKKREKTKKLYANLNVFEADKVINVAKVKAKKTRTTTPFGCPPRKCFPCGGKSPGGGKGHYRKTLPPDVFKFGPLPNVYISCSTRALLHFSVYFTHYPAIYVKMSTYLQFHLT